MRLKSIYWLLLPTIFDIATTTTSSTASTSSSSSIPKKITEQVEKNLISLFGFKGRPKVDRSKVVIPQAMLDFYEKQMGFHLDTAAIPRRGLNTRTANTIRSFTHVESPIDARFLNHHRFRLKFDVSKIPKSEALKAAELTITRRVVESLRGIPHQDYLQRVLINDIMKPGIKSKFGPITRLIDTKLVDSRRNTTLSFDVLPAVERWMDEPSSNHGLLVIIAGKGRDNTTTPERHLRLRRDLTSLSESTPWHSVQPLLFTYTDDGKNKPKTAEQIMQMRPKRAATRRRKKVEPCRRHSMFVDFSEVGWSDWIVAPNGYEAYYCQGECNFPLAEHLNTTNHAIVQTLMNSVSPSKVPKTCCVPTQFNAMSMLYLNDDKQVVLKNYGEMVVLGCGCR